MKFVKPYGRSKTEIHENRLVRKLHRRGDTQTLENLTDFVSQDPDVLLAQWVSAIDKVATKPTGKDMAIPRQREFRDKLGQQVWACITEKKLLPSEYREKFFAKIHPYPDGTKEMKGAQIRGRWYRQFFGDVPFWEADVQGFGQMLSDHLYGNAKRVHPESESRLKGLIEYRAGAISRSVPYARIQSTSDEIDRTKALKPPLWTQPQGQKSYCAKSNLPRLIQELAIAKEAKGEALLFRHVGSLLFAHYGELFRSDEFERVLTREEIRDSDDAGLLDYHDAVKDTYRRILSGHKPQNATSPKTAPPRGQPAVSKSKLSKILPKTPEGLFTRVMNGRKNQNVNALVRLGKVAHYSFKTASGYDGTSTTIKGWDASAINADSEFWTSEGQGQIKRNEALVRVWRSFLTSALVTLADWVNPNRGVEGDPATRDFSRMMESFDAAHFDTKSGLLFGAQSEVLARASNEEKRGVLKSIRAAVAALRNSSFHFKGRSQFAKDLSNMGGGLHAELIGAIYDDDVVSLGRRIIKDLQGASVDFLAQQRDLDTLLESLQVQSVDHPPQPKLNRMLLRAENSWKGDHKLQALPCPPNHRELEAYPALRCRYVVTKMLYNRVFPAWLKENSGRLNDWKDRALARTTSAAKAISRDEQAVARAARTLTFGEGGIEDITHLTSQISADTATEIRVQKGYDPDPDNAKKKSKYLDDVLMDIFALAFNDFLSQPKFFWLGKLNKDGLLPGQPISKFPDDFTTETTDEAENWQRMLYVVLHLVSTTEASRILHQLMKWDVLSSEKKTGLGAADGEQEKIARVMAVIKLYLDMSDDKFEGGEGLNLDETLRSFFDAPATFDRTYPAKSLEQDTLIPLRGLREAMRFGDLGKYQVLFSGFPIRAKFVDALSHYERGGPKSLVAMAQKKRTKLHKKWVDDSRLSADDADSYRKAVASIGEHREISAHVRFINHIRLHRLTIRLLGRFSDFAGLFERDVYFVTLSLMLERGTTPDAAFNKAGLDDLKSGQIMTALKNLTDDWIYSKLKLYFHIDFRNADDPLIAIRNRTQHVGYLFGDLVSDPSGDTALTTTGYGSFTEIANDIRQLMGYDRKLKNAVSKSIIGIMANEKLGLDWRMGEDHKLSSPIVSAHQAMHIKNAQNVENLNTRYFTRMVAKLFGGEARLEDDLIKLSRQ